jgi:hypothetical protein
MVAEPSSSLLSASNSGQLISSVNPNDVILGRGLGPSQFIGNQQFRSIVEQYQEEYTSIRGHQKREQKTRISKEIVAEVHTLGGRFLKNIEGSTPVAGAIAEEAIWLEVEESVALEKCKQALRDYRKKKASSTENGETNDKEENEDIESEGSSRTPCPVGDEIEVAPPSLERKRHVTTAPHTVLPPNSTPALSALLARLSAFHHQSMLPQLQWMNPVNTSELDHVPQSWNDEMPSSSMPVLPSVLVGRSDVGNAENCLFAFNQQAMAPQQKRMNRVNPSQINLDPQSRNDVRIIPDAYSLASRDMLSCPINNIAPEHGLATEIVTDGQGKVVEDQRKDTSDVAKARRSTSKAGVSAAAASEDELSSYLLSLLISDRPMITEEQLEIERAAMTDEERVATVTDLFGTQCTVDTRQSKKANRDLDTNAVDFLVNQMRLEIKRIPENSKRALLEAQTKCRADEFSDARLERFLRCEGMNAMVRL